MTKHKPSWREQRQLLAWEADLVRLKIIAAQMKNQQQANHSKQWQQALGLFNAIPYTGLALKTANLPKRWRHKAMLGGLLALLAIIKNRQS